MKKYAAGAGARLWKKRWRNRPDLLDGAALGDEDKQLLARITGKAD